MSPLLSILTAERMQIPFSCKLKRFVHLLQFPEQASWTNIVLRLERITLAGKDYVSIQ